MATAQQFLVHVTVDGAPLGVFDTMTGGDAVAKSVKHRPGGMGPEQSFTSLVSFTDITTARVYIPTRDVTVEATLIPKGGKKVGIVTRQPLDADGNAYGKALVFTGRFLGVKPPKVDSNSDAVAMFELDFSVTSVS
jgi:hypothetical protein